LKKALEARRAETQHDFTERDDFDRHLPSKFTAWRNLASR
jgi:hypothetical protein